MITGPILVAFGLTYGAAKKLMSSPGATRQAVSEALMNNPSLFGVIPANVREQLRGMKE